MRSYILLISLLLSLGSKSAFFDIPGLSNNQKKEFTLSFLDVLLSKGSSLSLEPFEFCSLGYCCTVKIQNPVVFQQKMRPTIYSLRKKLDLNVLDALEIEKISQSSYRVRIKDRDRYCQFEFTPQPRKNPALFLSKPYLFNFAFYPSSDLPRKTENRIREYAWWYDQFKTHLEAEGLSYTSLFNKRNTLYEQNNPAKLIQEKRHASHEIKIPKIMHYNWGMRGTDVIELSQEMLVWMRNSLSHNIKEKGWTHILWLYKKERFPTTSKIMKEMGVEVKEIEELKIDGGLESLRSVVYNFIHKNKHAEASDIFRLLAINSMGGCYVDLDYELFGCLDFFHEQYDFYGAIEPKSFFVGQAFFAAKPYHPIIVKCLDFISRNMNDLTRPMYEIVAGPVTLTGPWIITLGCHFGAGNDGNVDVILPPAFFYPAPNDLFPGNRIKPTDHLPEVCFGAHYWAGSWF